MRAERDKILFDMGMRPDAEYQAENYPGWTMQATARGNALVSAAGFSAKPLIDAQFSEAVAAKPIFPGDALASRLAIEAAPHWDAMLEQLRGIVNKAASLESHAR